jgi:hypothetical protein
MERIFAFVLLAATVVVANPVARAERQAGAHAAKLVRQAGHGFGFGAGVLVTAALAVSKKWNAPIVDASGRTQVIRLTGGGSYTLKQRHAPVVGPKLQAAALRINPDSVAGRLLRTFVTGVAAGATAAPFAEARYEAAFLKFLSGE